MSDRDNISTSLRVSNRALWLGSRWRSPIGLGDAVSGLAAFVGGSAFVVFRDGLLISQDTVFLLVLAALLALSLTDLGRWRRRVLVDWLPLGALLVFYASHGIAAAGDVATRALAADLFGAAKRSPGWARRFGSRRRWRATSPREDHHVTAPGAIVGWKAASCRSPRNCSPSLSAEALRRAPKPMVRMPPRRHRPFQLGTLRDTCRAARWPDRPTSREREYPLEPEHSDALPGGATVLALIRATRSPALVPPRHQLRGLSKRGEDSADLA